MKVIVIYLMQMILCSGLLYGYYMLFLKNKKIHRFNRFYLLGSVLLSLLVPIIKIPVYLNIHAITRPGVKAFIDYNNLLLPEVVVSSAKAGSFNWELLSYLLYAAMTLFLLFKLGLGINRLFRERMRNPIQNWKSITIIESHDACAPYSFFNWLFWNHQMDAYSEEGKKILQHEYYHIKEWHSLDVLITEMASCILWINPFFWWLKHELKTVHEFAADEYAVKNQDEFAYAALLVASAITYKKRSFVNPFFHNQLKRRITMLTNNKTSKNLYLRQLLLLPYAALLLLLFFISCKTREDKTAETVTNDIKIDTANTPQTQSNIEAQSSTSLPSTDKSAASKSETRKLANIEPEIFSKVEKEAEYPGGPKAWRHFLEQNLHGEVASDHGATAGTYSVIVQFVVDVAGNVSDVKTIMDPGYGMGTEAARVIKLSGKWKPAIQNGREVKAYRKQPVTFSIQE